MLQYMDKKMMGSHIVKVQNHFEHILLMVISMYQIITHVFFVFRILRYVNLINLRSKRQYEGCLLIEYLLQ